MQGYNSMRLAMSRCLRTCCVCQIEFRRCGLLLITFRFTRLPEAVLCANLRSGRGLRQSVGSAAKRGWSSAFGFRRV